jgi:pimeloyl-ACP methyl ester carboxylesterase
MPSRSPTVGPAERALLAELAPLVRERFVPVAGGGRLRVLEAGDGPPLVLLHGRGGASSLWFPVLPALARHHRVLAVDLPGFGSSDAGGFVAGSAADAAERAIRFFVDPVEAWLLAEGVRAPALVGHSLGGLVAVELALRARVAPSALVLLAPLGVGAEITTGARLFFTAGPERLARALGRAAFLRVVPPSGPDASRIASVSYEIYAVPGGRRDASAAFRCLSPLVGPAPNRGARLREIAAPTLLLWGEDDEALPCPLGIAAAAALPRGELRLVAGGHVPQHEDPVGTVAAIEGFLGRVCGAPSSVPS